MSATDFILSVGLEGSFELAPPFTNKIRAKTRYTIRSIRAMSDLISAGENPQDLYDAVEIGEADFVRDLQADVCIIGLQSSLGEWVYVPQTYIATLPQFDGVSYRPLTAAVPLGLMPDDKSMENLLTAINALVMEHLGVQSESVIVAVGAAELVSFEDHDRITAERAARVTYSESEAAKMVRLQRENDELRTQNAALAEHIRALV